MTTVYQLSAPVTGNFAQAKATLFALLQENQLTVVSDVDVQATLKEKLGKTMRPYHIFGACNAKLAERIIDAEPSAGTLLPCTFVLREESDDASVVSFMHPQNVLGLAHSSAAQEVAATAQEKVEKIIAALHAIA